MDSHHLIACFFQMRENLVQKKKKKRALKKCIQMANRSGFYRPKTHPRRF